MNAVDPALRQGEVGSGRDMGTARRAPGASGAVFAGPANTVALLPRAAPLGGYAFSAGFGDGTVLSADGVREHSGPGAPEAVKVIAHEAAVTGLAMVSGTLVSAGQDGTVRTEDGVIATPGGWAEHLTATPDRRGFAVVSGRAVVTGTLDGEAARFADHPSTVSGLAFAPDGRQLAASHYNGVTIWSTKTGAKVRTLAFKGSHIGVSWSPDARFIVSTTQERELHVWDLATDKDYRLGGYAAKVRSLAWLTEPMHLVCSGADAITAWPFGDVGPGVLPPKEIGFAYKATVARVAVDPARSRVAGGYTDGAVLLGGVRKGEASYLRTPDGDAVTALAISPDGLVLAGTRAGRIEIIAFSGTVQ
ncbi:WD40 repeat domain-containing protein [Acuticoccus kandeliae]|uniref:WD40 repeat domain-containing protein n=1 Tax=Acuticoccus kandeliae TaxID=2073160 RepID=UPI000D3E78D9|nr:hypothetical protein [Acuticoccus kandeliae]